MKVLHIDGDGKALGNVFISGAVSNHISGLLSISLCLSRSLPWMRLKGKHTTDSQNKAVVTAGHHNQLFSPRLIMADFD